MFLSRSLVKVGVLNLSVDDPSATVERPVLLVLVQAGEHGHMNL